MNQKIILFLLFSIIFSSTVLAQNILWSEVSSESTRQYTRGRENNLPLNFRLVKLNRALAAERQRLAPMENLANRAAAAASFDIPLPDGSLLKAGVIESPIVSARTKALLNNTVKTYALTDAAGKKSMGRLTISEQGITGIVFTDKGTVYISPVGSINSDVHLVYFTKDSKSTEKAICGVREEASNLRLTGTTAGDCQLRTYRLAVAATGEYTTWAGSQANALTYITTTVNSLNAIYERDATIRFTLVTNNSIIYTDAATDPYNTVTFPNQGFPTLNENVTAINGAIGSANYDLGIVFNNGWNGGLAQLSSVCGGSKARAAAGLDFGTGANPTPGPQGPVFEGTVAHEIAHQFGVTHTHSATNGSCGGGNISASTAWETGGGSTIMAYAGVCTGNSYQNNSDLYFHIGSILQMQSFNTAAGCPVTTSSGNAAPAISVPASAYTIPISTPFTLTSTATDADGDALTYSWEQLDAGTSAAPPAATSTTGPNFRSYPASSSPSRTFPRMSDIVAGISPTYEVLPSVSRSMYFGVTVRDNVSGAGCTDEIDVTVNTDVAAGPFIVTSQNTTTTWTANGTNTETISWNVANTNNAPVSCPNVNILFSIDGGVTYPYTLLANTPNDGTENITVPNLPTNAGRLMVQAANNVFFNINTANITITSSCSAEGTTVSPSTDVEAIAGSATLDLTLSPVYGSVVTPSGTLETTDPASSLAVNNLAVGSCINFGGNPTRYDVYRFTVNVAGSYTFTRTTGSVNTVYSLYNDIFTPGAPCSNLIVSSHTYNGSGTNQAPFTVTLTPGLYYTLAVTSFSGSAPTLPSAYVITVTPPAGGSLYSATPNPGAGFNYTYLVVNNASGNIVAIDANANLSNAGTFPAGLYTVYGLSYSNSISLATLNAYVGGPFATLQNDALFNPATLCSNLSKNSVAVEVLAGTLSVQGLTLKASGINNTVLLQWSTAAEQNNSHFEVLRSADGVHFDQLGGTVQSKGNSSTTTHYSLTDPKPGLNWNYYRIRQVDKDGHSTLSNIANVNIEKPLVTVQVYPNPAQSVVTLEYITEKRETIQVQISDSKGAIVLTAQVNTQSGINTKTFNVSGLAKGIYSVQVIGGAGSTLSRFIKE
jgi:hypothetical protein